MFSVFGWGIAVWFMLGSLYSWLKREDALMKEHTLALYEKLAKEIFVRMFERLKADLMKGGE